MGKRPPRRLVPLAGAVTGATLNAAYLHDIGRAAYVSYRRRFINNFIAGADNQTPTPRRKKDL